MKIFKKKKGFTVIEVLVAAGIIAILVIMAGALSSKFALRRSVDQVAFKITSSLNLVKLQAARNGVQYQAELSYDTTGNKLKIETKMGDSNRFSDFADISPSSTEQITMLTDYEIIPSNTSVQFNPNQTVGGSGTIQIKPRNVNAVVDKCGVIVISPFGRIRTVTGHWDFGTSECKPIFDEQAQP